MKASKLTLWSIICCYFVDPDIWMCLKECRYCSNWNVSRKLHKFYFFFTTWLFKLLKPSTTAIKSNYSTFCCTLLVATLCSRNSWYSHVLFNEAEWQRHWILFMSCLLLGFAQNPMLEGAKYIYLMGDNRLLYVWTEFIEWQFENHR